MIHLSTSNVLAFFPIIHAMTMWNVKYKNNAKQMSVMMLM